MLFVINISFARTVARTTVALRVRNTEVSVKGIQFTSSRRGKVRSAGPTLLDLSVALR